MIPFAFPPVEFYLLMLISLLAGASLLVYLALLAFTRKMRQRFARRPWRGGILLVILALLAYPYARFHYDFRQMRQESALRQAALRIVLSEPLTLDGAILPAGARLVLTEEGKPESYREASFDTPAPAFGLRVTRIERHLRSEYDPETRQPIGQRAHTIHAWGEGDQEMDGWSCDTSHKVEFRVPDGDTLPVFQSCTLAGGNQADGIDLPAGATVQARDGNPYTDGYVEPLRWLIRIDGEDPVAIQGLVLGRPSLKLDEQRRLMGIAGNAELACPLQLGPMRYPAGTLVETLGYPMNRQAPDAWVFSPANGNAALRDGGDEVPDGMSVVQRHGGAVLDIVSNARAGVMRPIRLEVDGRQAPQPVRCPS